MISDDFKGYFLLNYFFNKDLDDDYYNNIYNKIFKFMNSNPKDILFLKVKENSYIYEYRDLKTNKSKHNLLKKILVKDKISEKWGDWNMEDIPIKIFIHKNKLSITGSHAYIDGYTLMNKYFIKFICPDTNKIKINLLKFKYNPLLCEFYVLKSFYNSIKMNYRNLDLIKWNKRKSMRSITCDISINIIKNKKLKYKNYKYSTILASIYLRLLFLSCKNKIKSLNILFIVALKNKSSFNNFGFISFKVNKTDNLNKLIEDIELGIKNNYDMIETSYIYTNLIGLNNNLYDKIDCVFSFIPVSNGDLVCGSYKVVDCNLVFPYSTAPIYIFSSSFSGYEHCTMNICSSDVDKNKLIDLLKEISKKNSVKLSKDYIKK